MPTPKDSAAPAAYAMTLPKGTTSFSCGGVELETRKLNGAHIVDVPAEFVGAAADHGLTTAEVAA